MKKYFKLNAIKIKAITKEVPSRTEILYIGTDLKRAAADSELT